MIQFVNVGLLPNDGTGDALRDAFIILNANVQELVDKNVITDAELVDLQNQIDGKAPLSHTHLISQISGLQALLDSKVNTTTYTTDILFINTSITNILLALDYKFNIPTGNSSQYLDGAGVPRTFPTIPDVSGFVPYTGATQDVELGENKYISDKGFEIPTSDKGVFKVDSEGSYNTLDFISDGTEGTPTVALKINSEDGVQTYVNTEDNTYGSSLIQQPTALSVNAYSPTDLNDFLIEADKTTTNKPISLPKTVFNSDIETAGEKELVWNDQDGTLDIGLKGGNVTLQVGQEQLVRVVNKTGSDLLEANYQVVRVDGAQGNRLKVALAQATTDLLSAETIGIVTETINDNQEGFVTTSGLVRNINTTGSLQSETWTDGDILYLSPTVAGQLTKVKPTAPNHLVVMGYVVRAHVTQGQIYVKVDNGYELDELHNVVISSPVNNQILRYNSTSQIWQNSNISEFNDLQVRRGGYILFDDFHTSNASGQSPFIRSAIGGGTTGVFSNANHPGILRLNSSTTLNSGVSILPFNSAAPVTAILQSGMRFDTLIRLTVGAGTATIRCGLIHGSNTSADMQNGCYFEIVGTNLVGKTANASTRSSTPSYSLILSTFYHLRVTYNSTTLNTFEVFDMSGSLLFSGTLTTNINTGSVTIQPGLIATNSGTTSTQLVDVDYIGFTYPPLTRGSLT